MTINKTLYHAERWRDRVLDGVVSAINGMTKVWRLEDVYPQIQVETPEGPVFKANIMPHQKAFHAGVAPSGRKAKFRIHSGGYGSGKSIAFCAEIIYLLRRYPGIEIVVVTAYDYYFDETIYNNFDKVLDRNDPFWGRKNERARTRDCVNGSKLRFKAYDDAEKVKGWQAHVIGIEEGSEMGDGNSYKAISIFKALLGRLRAPGYFPLTMMIIQNPNGHNWIWKLGVKGNPYGDEGLERSIPPCKLWSEIKKDDPVHRGEVDKCQATCQYLCKEYPQGLRYFEYELVMPSGDVIYTIRSGTNANTYNPAEYLATMIDQYADDPELKARRIDGGFAPLNTLVYDWPWYSVGTHVVTLDSVLEAYDWHLSQYPEIPKSLPLYVGIDVGGATSPWAIEVYVILPDDIALCIGEYYKAGVTWDTVTDAVHALTLGWQNVTFWIDPYSAPQKQGPDQKSVELHFHQAGIPVQTPQGYNRIGGYQHVRNLLKVDRQERCPFVTVEERPDMKGGKFLHYGRDEWDEEKGQYEIGRARLYYLQGACPANLAEKAVWRFNNKKGRQPTEAEEGLTKLRSETPVDSDDHAQTSEIFAMGGWSPMPRRQSRRKRDVQPGQPKTKYGRRYGNGQV